MTERQIIYPCERLLANPRIFQAIANYFDGPEWEVFAEAFYDLVESEFLDNLEVDPAFEVHEVCFREKPEEDGVFQVILPSGVAIELKPTPDKQYAAVTTEDELNIVTAIYGRIVKAIEEERPDLKGNVVLCDPPTPSNGFLRSADGETFAGDFHLLDDPETLFNFTIDVVDLQQDILKARVEPA